MTKEEFEVKFKEYLNEQGPNPGTGWISKMGCRQSHEFEILLSFRPSSLAGLVVGERWPHEEAKVSSRCQGPQA